MLSGMTDKSLLFRGYGLGYFDGDLAAVTPKQCGEFAYSHHYDGKLGGKVHIHSPRDGSADRGHSAQNAVLVHQSGQCGLPTAGISTTPLRERARFYAMGEARHEKGVILIIDRRLLAAHGVTEYCVNAMVREPSVPEDEEVILVAADGGPLPSEIIVDREIVERGLL